MMNTEILLFLAQLGTYWPLKWGRSPIFNHQSNINSQIKRKFYQKNRQKQKFRFPFNLARFTLKVTLIISFLCWNWREKSNCKLVKKYCKKIGKIVVAWYENCLLWWSNHELENGKFGLKMLLLRKSIRSSLKISPF